MKVIKLIFVLTFLFTLSNILYCDTSLGVSLGEPSGISVKLQSQKNTGYDITCGFDTLQNYFLLSCDLLKYDYTKIVSKELTGKLPVCYGVGINVGQFRHDTYIGIRIVAGLEYIFADIPLNIFVKIAPVVNIFPATTVHLAPSIGIRYIFK